MSRSALRCKTLYEAPAGPDLVLSPSVDTKGWDNTCAAQPFSLIPANDESPGRLINPPLLTRSHFLSFSLAFPRRFVKMGSMEQ